MTNLELSRRAAQAIGMRVTESKGKLYLADGTEWAPLVDGNQCIMLVARGGLLLASSLKDNETTVFTFDADVNETHKKSPEAATKRAIVRAAASRVTK